MTVEVRRFDRSKINVTRRDDGVIIGEAVATRAGVFKYRQPDGTIRAEFRSPLEVFKADSMASARMVPITDRHPSDFVRPENAKELSVGFTGENVRADGHNLVVPLNINTAEGVAAVDGGRNELSFGYGCEVVESSGRWDGEEYTHAQRNIKYNHLALVESARAGKVASLRLDAHDAVMQIESERKESVTMGEKVRLDSGISVECDPHLAADFNKARSEREDAQKKADDLQKKLDSITAERDELKERVEKAEKVDHSAEIEKGIKARMSIVERASKVLDEDEVKKFDDMSNDEIRNAVIAKKYPDLDLSEKSGDYLSSRFDAICETLDEADDGTAQKNADKVLGDPKEGKRADGMSDHEKKRDEAIVAMKKKSHGQEE
jgi:hypothetical protein